MSLSPMPIRTPFLDKTGTYVSWPWIQWFQGLVNVASLVFGFIPVSFTSNIVFNVTNNLIVTFALTLTGDVVSSSISGAQPGQIVIFQITQDAIGGHLFSWPTTVANSSLVDARPNSTSVLITQWNGTEALNLAPMTYVEP